MFKQGLRVWGHPTAYMDEVICSWHSSLIQEEAPQAVLQQDCFSGELTQTVLSQKFVRQQAQHVIGPHVTGRLQLTDTTFAAGAKAAGDRAKGVLRKRLREKANQEGVPVRLKVGALELMQVATAMHSDMSQRAGGALVKAMRAAHFLDFLPCPAGLVPVATAEAQMLPAGSHRLEPSWAASKNSWLLPGPVYQGEPTFKPQPPDWTRLNKLRKDQQSKKRKEEALEDEDAEFKLRRALSTRTCSHRK